jgi:organic hydroperoxide reductase OsmC/OhrA
MDTFTTHIEWTGAAAGPTRDHVAFSRDLSLLTGANAIPMSSAPRFRGDATRVNPEQLFVGAVSACHALTFLFLAGRAGVAVTAYEDDAEGTLALADGRLRMTHVVLRPKITLESAGDDGRARELLAQAHRDCFIANSVSSRVEVLPAFVVPRSTEEAA